MTFSSKNYAEDLTFGLCINGYVAILILKEDYMDKKNPAKTDKKAIIPSQKIEKGEYGRQYKILSAT